MLGPASVSDHPSPCVMRALELSAQIHGPAQPTRTQSSPILDAPRPVSRGISSWRVTENIDSSNTAACAAPTARSIIAVCAARTPLWQKVITGREVSTLDHATASRVFASSSQKNPLVSFEWGRCSALGRCPPRGFPRRSWPSHSPRLRTSKSWGASGPGCEDRRARRGGELRGLIQPEGGSSGGRKP